MLIPGHPEREQSFAEFSKELRKQQMLLVPVSRRQLQEHREESVESAQMESQQTAR